MSHKILIVDDDELVLISVKTLLESEGFIVDTASNGKDALAQAESGQFDLFMLDVIMPGMSGFDVCQALRATERYKQAPIVVLTAKSAEADRKKGIEAGATRFLPKPIQPESLLSVLEEVSSLGPRA